MEAKNFLSTCLMNLCKTLLVIFDIREAPLYVTVLCLPLITWCQADSLMKIKTVYKRATVSQIITEKSVQTKIFWSSFFKPYKKVCERYFFSIPG